MRIGPNETVDDCLDILQTVFQSSAWRQLPNEDRLRIVGRLEHILEIAQLKTIGG